MASDDDLTLVYTALRNADKAGDTAAATKLAAYIKTRSPGASKNANGDPSDVPLPYGSPDPNAEGNKARHNALNNQLLPEKIGGVLEAGRTIVQNSAVGLASGLVEPFSPSLADKIDAKGMHVPQNIRADDIVDHVAKTAGDLKLEGLGPMAAEGQAIEHAGQVVSPMLGKAASQVGAEIKSRFAKAGVDTAAQDAEKAVRSAGVKAARDAGYILPPSQANPTLLNGVLEGVSGKVKTAQSAATKNQVVTDGLVRKSLGLSEDAPITPETLKAVRDQAGESYQAISNLGTPFKATEQYHAAIETLGQATKDLAKKFPKIVSSKEIDDLKGSLKVDEIEPEHAVELNKLLREKASDHLGPTASGPDKTLGRAYRKAADAVEQMMEANLAKSGQKALLEDFRKNRQLIAKTYTVEKALNSAGHVDANNLAAQLKREKPLSGELRTVAKFASQFPKAARTPEQIGSHLPIDALDGLAAIGSGVAAGHLIGGAAVLARPAIRGAILSKPGQALLIGEGKALPAATKTVRSAATSASTQAKKTFKSGQRFLKDHKLAAPHRSYLNKRQERMSKRILIVDTDGVGLAFAWRCIQFGHKVKWFVAPRPTNNPNTGKGFAGIERIQNWVSAIPWADLVFATSNDEYIPRLEFFKKRGVKVFAPSVASADLEVKRAKGMEFFKKHGIDVPAYKTFKSLEEAEAYVWKKPARYVFKPMGDEADKALTYCSKQPADMIDKLREWIGKGMKLKGECMLQEFIEGNEFAVSRWMGSKGWIGLPNINWEHKPFMSGPCGPNTGEAGTVMAYVEKDRLFDDVLEPLETALMDLGHLGDIDVNCIIDKKGKAWPMEFTMRPGWPAFNIMLQEHKGDPAQWMLDACNGKDTLQASKDVAIGVVVSIPPYPNPSKREDVEGIPIYGVTKKNQKYLLPQGVMMQKHVDMDGDEIVEREVWSTSSDYVFIATGLGETIKKASERVYGTIKEISVSGKQYRDDVGESLETELGEIQKNGYATTIKYD